MKFMALTMTTKKWLIFLSLLALASSARPLPRNDPQSICANVRPLYLFPNGTAGENIFIRSDGSVLMSMIYPAAELYYFPSPYGEPILLHNFTKSLAGYRIAEYAPDQLAVLTGTFSRTGLVTNATGHVWRVDISSLDVENGVIRNPANISRLATIYDAGFLNGATTLDEKTVLASDSVLGVVYAIDTQNGNYSIALNDTALSPNATGAVRLGVNGLQRVNDTLYYTNTNKRTVGKVLLNDDGSAAGPFETVASHILVDDLDVDAATGAIYIPSLVANEVQYVAPDGAVRRIVGSLNSTDVPGPTAIKIWEQTQNGMEAKTKLLVATSGGIEYPINGTYIMGGGLYEIDVTMDLVEGSDSRVRHGLYRS